METIRQTITGVVLAILAACFITGGELLTQYWVTSYQVETRATCDMTFLAAYVAAVYYYSKRRQLKPIKLPYPEKLPHWDLCPCPECSVCGYCHGDHPIDQPCPAPKPRENPICANCGAEWLCGCGECEAWGFCIEGHGQLKVRDPYYINLN